MLKFKRLSNIEKRFLIKNTFLILFGTIALAFGTAIFLTKLNIVSGGLAGIAIIIQFFFGSKFAGGQIIDIVVFIFTWLFFFLGLFTLGKEFALKTLLSSIIYPLALSLFLRVPKFIELSETIAYYGMSSPTDVVPIGNIILCGIFGGVFIGLGVALNFSGGGSSGGVDIIVALISKYTNIKESVISFVVDSSVIFCGMFIIPGNLVPCLNGILSACVTALMIEYFFVNQQTSYQADIISEKWEEISSYVQDVLGRGATIIDAVGGYKGEQRNVLRVVFPKSQYRAIREIIGKIDPKAFVTFTQTNGVYGEGFKKNHSPKIKK